MLSVDFLQGRKDIVQSQFITIRQVYIMDAFTLTLITVFYTC
jgi:hypothetical protein